MRMNALRPSQGFRGAVPVLLATALFASGALSIGAQDAAAPAASSPGSEDDMFGSPETVTQANQSSKEAAGTSEFLKYDQTKVGGTITGKIGFSSIWSPAYDGSSKLFKPSDYYLSPDLEGKVTLVAKPLTDFGVNMDFRTSWPFTTTAKDSNGDTYTAPNISVWSLYSKFNWQDKVYFSFGKQPLSWGVSKGYFQPADDIFAVSAAIDPTNTGAEREGPVSLKTTIPLGVTNNLYFYAGLPSAGGGSSSPLLQSTTSATSLTNIDPADARLAVKGEFGFGNTEAALAAFYAYNDYPRLLAMGTTGIGSWNIYGEGVLKYGSERYFISETTPTWPNPLGLVGSQESGKLYFTGTLGCYYTDSDNRVTIMAAYMYNGEAQRGVDYQQALSYYMIASNTANWDRSKFGTHYAFASFSKGNIFHDKLGIDKLSASLIAIADLSDLSGYIMPSLTWTFFDYMSLQTGATINFGQAGDEYITNGVGNGSDFGATKPGIAFNLLLTVGTGSF